MQYIQNKAALQKTTQLITKTIEYYKLSMPLTFKYGPDAATAVLANTYAVTHYLTGKGTPVSLASISGVTQSVINKYLSPQITQANYELISKWLQSGSPVVKMDKTNKAYLNNWCDTENYFLEKTPLFFMGKGQLFAGLESNGALVKIHYWIRDKFEEPGKTNSLNFFEGEFIGGTPYQINWDEETPWYFHNQAAALIHVTGSPFYDSYYS